MTALGFRLVTARRSHLCELCGETIARGVAHHRWAWGDNGSVRTIRAHRPCETIRRDVADISEWTTADPPLREWLFDRVDAGPDEPPHLDVLCDDEAGEWRALWAAICGGTP